jgi:hypothetical protein
MNKFFADFYFVFRLYLRMCFAPFVGAWRGLEAEYEKAEAEYAARFGSWRRTGDTGVR